MNVKKRLAAPLLALAMLALPGAAQAVITAGGATIHNAATLTFTGGTARAQVNVGVQTIASAPTIAVNTTAQSVDANASATYTYTVTNNANGSDTFSFNGTSVDQNTTGAATLNVAATGTASTSLTLGASITSQASDAAGHVFIPAGSEMNLAVGDTVVINGVGTYTIATITPGTIASTTGGVTTPETPTTLTFTAVGGAPAIGLNTVPAGTQLGEQQTFTTVVTASSPTTAGTNGTHTVNFTGATTATQTVANGGGVVTYTTSAASGNETITTVLSPNVTLVKKVRNVTQGVTTFATTGVNAQAGDVLEYQLTATEGTGVTAATGNVLTDEVPAFTTYKAGSTTLNGVAVTDGAGGTLPLSSANGGLQINSTGQPAGTIAAGASAVVTFQVTVN